MAQTGQDDFEEAFVNLAFREEIAQQQAEAAA